MQPLITLPSNQRPAFLGSSYGAAQRAFLAQQPSGFCPDWVSSGAGYAILTAWNPMGVQATAPANAQAQARLEAELLGLGYRFGRGHNGAGEWREDTVIVPGLPLGLACTLGRQYTQAAVLWGAGRRVALVWLEGDVKIERYWWSGKL